MSCELCGKQAQNKGSTISHKSVVTLLNVETLCQGAIKLHVMFAGGRQRKQALASHRVVTNL